MSMSKGDEFSKGSFISKCNVRECGRPSSVSYHDGNVSSVMCMRMALSVHLFIPGNRLQISSTVDVLFSYYSRYQVF